MRALSIRQPYAELILRGIKKMEYRSRRTRIIGERFYIYAARPKTQEEKDGGEALTPDPSPGPRSRRRGEKDLHAGVIVGTAIITGCTVVRASRPNGNGAWAGRPCHQHYQWHLSDVKRLKQPRKPKRMPQPVWFTPF